MNNVHLEEGIDFSLTAVTKIRHKVVTFASFIGSFSILKPVSGDARVCGAPLQQTNLSPNKSEK